MSRRAGRILACGLIVAMGRRNVELDVDKLRTLRG